MREVNEHTITDAVIERISKTPDPRTHQLMKSLVTHIHDFVRENRITYPEWEAAIGFLTRTGQTCTTDRQEFILLSDTLGVTMLVDAVNHANGGPSTETTVLGPFYNDHPPLIERGANIANGEKGQPLYVAGRVFGPDGTPVANATVDTWHSDANGFYDVQLENRTGPSMRGRLRTDAEGNFWFWTILPHSYPVPTDGPVGEMLRATARHPYRPAHVHFLIDAPGCDRLVTHVFLAGDEYLESDTVFAVKDALVHQVKEHPPGKTPTGSTLTQPWHEMTYEFHLASRPENVRV